jgi:RNA polymerase sigma-70 factor (ECF subfamily)
MSNAPLTRPSLLIRLRDSTDLVAWEEFVDVYAPLVYGFLRKRGLQDADAADLTQEVMRAVCMAAGRFEYRPERGSFRGWLFTIVRNKLLNFHSSGHGRIQGTGDTNHQRSLEQLPTQGEDEESIWMREWEKQLFITAAGRVQRTVQAPTWQAFWLTAVEGKKAAAVGKELGLSVASVYLARSRVVAKIRQAVEELAGNEAWR